MRVYILAIGCVSAIDWYASHALVLPFPLLVPCICRRVTRELVEGWQRFTPHPLHVHSVEGGHMWPVDKQARIPWVKSIVQVLQDVLDGSS